LTNVFYNVDLEKTFGMEDKTKKEMLREAFDRSPIGIILTTIERICLGGAFGFIAASLIYMLSPHPEEKAEMIVAMTIFCAVLFTVFMSMIPHSFFMSKLFKANQKMIEQYKAKKKKLLIESTTYAKNRITRSRHTITENQKKLETLKAM
jgi:uncharacterized membrane protein (DUF106 family)